MNLEKSLSIGGWIEPEELLWLAGTASESKSILELGAFLGKSTRALCDNTSGKVFTIDLWAQTPGGLEADWESTISQFSTNLKDHIDTGKLNFLRMSTDNGLSILQNIDLRFDFIFIDADHRYEQVKRDIEGCLSLLLPGGIISGHDMNWEGVNKAVVELIPDYKLFKYIWYKRI